MNKPENKTPPPSAPAEEVDDKPERRSAMKLPEGVRPRGPGGPPQKGGWDRGAAGRPQRDAARRAGKSRKVH